MTLSVGSLFSGIGGLDLGLERAGMRVAWQVERDEYAQKVLRKHWPAVKLYDDVRDVHGPDACSHVTGIRCHSEWCLQRVDLICGGFPCQDISNAGKRSGIDGSRSGLWSEYIRLVRQLRPHYVLVENVSALLARGLGRILGDLATCGYDAEWDCVPASAVGAHHRRDRLFVVAYAQRDPVRLESERHQREGRGVRAAVGGHSEPLDDGAQRTVADPQSDRRGAGRSRGPAGDGENGSAERPEALADADGGRLQRRREPQPRRVEGSQWRVFDGRGALRKFADTTLREQWATEPDVGRVADGVPARVDRLRCLGNAVVPQVAEFIGRRIIAFDQLSQTQIPEGGSNRATVSEL